VSQPFNRSEAVLQPGSLDSELDEFWVSNPWYIQKTHNLSSFERNRMFLNSGGGNFWDVSHISRADSEGDARSVVAANLRGDGQLDLLVRQVGGGPVLIYENQFPKRHWLELSLRGVTSNRFGVGAQVTATIGRRKMVRALFPQNSYRSQTPFRVHFGIGEAEQVDQLHVLWPSGVEQIFTNIAGDRHLQVVADSDEILPYPSRF
jgi:hypothetical protein